jgi:predicted DCC family thiol-disulfide oxidoreductase YuxK
MAGRTERIIASQGDNRKFAHYIDGVEAARHILFFDGVCGMCDRIVQFVLARDRKRQFQFATLQSPIAARLLQPFGKDPSDVDTIYVIADADGDGARVMERGRAVLFILRRLGGAWGVLAAMAAIFPTALIDFFYRRVASNRYRVFGKLDACRIPSAEERTRFLESGEASR